MRKLGLIGGMSWESTLVYYQLLNRSIQTRLGGLHSALCVIHSVDFAPIAAWQNQGKWQEASEVLCSAAKQLESIGAEGLVLCTNTMHKLAPDIRAAIKIPLLHIIDATAHDLRQKGLKKLLLLGTRYTMEDAFYSEYMRDRFHIDIRVPDATARDAIHTIIYQELCRGKIVDSSRKICLSIIKSLASEGIEGVILGCTELGLLLQPQDLDLPLFDTTALHVQHAADWMLES